MRITLCIRLLLAVLILGSHQAYAWIYPEHRYIALLAIQKLSPERRAALDKLWLQARMGHADRLTESVIDPEQGFGPTQLDYAAWTGIAGDHSCSPDIMLNTVLKSDWILHVADITARLQVKIDKSKNRSQHINALRDSDIRLQRADPEYATRAGSNNVHFLLARPEVDTDTRNYLTSCLKKGTALNALGAYSWFHMDAMSKAARYAQENLTEEEKSALILAALADEAFALHFLEDVYASGHTAGTWGAASVRKGTHDYYNEKGLETETWDGKRAISLGDAFMRKQDAEFAAVSVQLSLEQLIRAATGEWVIDYERDILASHIVPDTFNVCKNNFMPARPMAEAEPAGKMKALEYLPEILVKTPVPGLATGLGEIPRFRSELGMFFGISSSLNGGSVLGGFGKTQTEGGALGGIEANLRFGFGLDGVLNQAGDGLVFLQAGFRQDASSINKYSDGSGTGIPPGAVPAAIPGRSAYNVRLRVPFWLIPGDLLIAGPILALVSPKTVAAMAVTAGNGGLIPWQSGMATPIGRFQFVLGREVGVSFYGTKENGLLIPGNNGTVYISYASTKFDFPILEYMPFRTFSLDQSSSMIVQLTTGVDFPHGASVILPVGEPVPELKPVWNIGVRIIFDWRHYL